MYVWARLYICLSVYEGYNLYSFVRLPVYIIFQRSLYQIMYHSLGSKIMVILLIPNSTGNYKPGLPGGAVVKNPPDNAGDMGLISGSEKSPGGGNGSPPQYFCLEHPMDRGAWWATVQGVTSQTRLSDSTATDNKAAAGIFEHLVN